MARSVEAGTRKREAASVRNKKEEDSNMRRCTRKKLKRTRQSEEQKMITMINNTLHVDAATGEKKRRDSIFIREEGEALLRRIKT